MSPVDKAREEYAALRAALAPRNHVTHHTDCGCFTIAADALIAALEARIEELKVCGNCGLFEIDWDGLETTCPGYTKGTWMRCYHTDHCHFTPSRWQRRQP